MRRCGSSCGIRRRPDWVAVAALLWLVLLAGYDRGDDYWSEAELSTIRSLSLSTALAPLPSVSNRYADVPAAAALGKQLFFDTQFSGNQSLACASCHQPEKAFTDGQITGKGLAVTDRNTPSVIGLSSNEWFYWDGRKDSLWAQALTPFEAAKEMGGNRLAIVRAIGANAKYRRQYETLFGRFPIELLGKQMPRNAGPLGSPTERQQWFQLTRGQQQTINRVFVNLGKALEAYQRGLRFAPTPFDRYVEKLLESGHHAAASLMSDEALAGLRLFIDETTTQCLQCHNGHALSNGDFHNVGSGRFTSAPLDFGRLIGLQAVMMDEFNCLGPYSDADSDDCKHLRFISPDIHDSAKGAYKVPSLRNLVKTAPYFHDGRYASLADAVGHYFTAANQTSINNGSELRELVLTDQQQRELVSFLASLSEE